METFSLQTLMEDPEIWVVVAFVLFLGVGWRYILPIIVKGLDARGEAIRSQLEQAKRLREEAEALLAHSRVQEAQAAREAQEILAQAKRDANALRERAADELHQNLTRRTRLAEEKIARAEAEAVAELRQQMVEAASEKVRTMLATQVTDESSDPALTKALGAIESHFHHHASNTADGVFHARAAKRA